MATASQPASPSQVSTFSMLQAVIADFGDAGAKLKIDSKLLDLEGNI